MSRPAWSAVGAGALFAGLFLVVLATAAWLAARTDVTGNLADGAVYLVLADYFSPWHAGDAALGLDVLRRFPFPPLYPLLLGLAGGGGANLPASYAAGALCEALAALAVALWAHRRGHGCAVALALAVLATFAPGRLLGALEIQSESLYIALTYGGFAAIASGRTGASGNGPAALLLGLAAVTRTVGVAAIVAFGVAVGLRARRGRLVLLLVALAPLLAWSVARRLLEADAGYLELLLRPSSAAWYEVLVAQAANNLVPLWRGLAAALDPAVGTPARVFALLLLGNALLYACWRARRGDVEALYLLGYLALVLPWPFPEHMRRFVVVLLPLVLLFALEVLSASLRSAAASSLRRAALLAAGIACALVEAPGMYTILSQVAAARTEPLASYVRSPQWHRQRDPLRALRTLDNLHALEAALRALDRTLPRAACVSSPLHAYLPLLAGRRARALPRQGTPLAMLEAAVRECPYVLMVSVAQYPANGYPPLYPWSRLRERLDVLELTHWPRGPLAGQVMTILARHRGTVPDDFER